jgi:hypothetical protein
MASERQILANRANALKSTGPRSAAGRMRSSLNAYRHGLSLPITLDPLVRAEIEAVAQAIAGETAGEDQLEAAKAFAEAQFDLKRIRDTRVAATPVVLDEMFEPRVLTDLCALDRYERLARARRRLAVRRFKESIERENASSDSDRTKPIYLRPACAATADSTSPCNF